MASTAWPRWWDSLFHSLVADWSTGLGGTPLPSPRDDSVADSVEPPKQVQAAQEEADNKPPPLFFGEEDLKQEVRNCAGHGMASGGRPPRRLWWTPSTPGPADSH